jgi:hypothetical protein
MLSRLKADASADMLILKFICKVLKTSKFLGFCTCLGFAGTRDFCWCPAESQVVMSVFADVSDPPVYLCFGTHRLLHCKTLSFASQWLKIQGLWDAGADVHMRDNDEIITTRSMSVE